MAERQPGEHQRAEQQPCEPASEPAAAAADAVAEYKRILQRVLENRPSGTRQRLAAALGKNRSFISQIANPAYTVPIPAIHLETIFEICHFPPEERKRFLDAYERVHARRLKLVKEVPRRRSRVIYLPDLGDEARNRALEKLVSTFVADLIRLL
jgi:hypothetical protein